MAETSGPLTIEKAVRVARQAREKHAPFWRLYNRELVGSRYQEGHGSRHLVPYAYMFETTFLPELAAKRGEAVYRAHAEFQDGPMADLISRAANAILRRQRFLEQLRLCVKDGLYACMFGHVFVDDLPSFYGDDKGFARAPGFERLSPFDMLYDPTGQHFYGGAYAGHEYGMEHEALLALYRGQADDATIAAIELRGGSGQETMSPEDQARYRLDAKDPVTNWHKLIRLYVRPTHQLYTLWEESKDIFRVLKKEAFYGPRSRMGPYHMGGFLPVNKDGGEVMPLAPAVAWWDQVVEVEKNMHEANQDAQAEHRMVTCEEGDAANLKKYVKGQRNHAASGLKGVSEIHTGGVSSERQAILTMFWQLLEMSSGVRAVGKQNISGDTTATTATIMASGTNSRMSDMRGESGVAGFVAAIQDDIGWYVYEDPGFRTMLTVPGPMGTPVDVEFAGGNRDPVTGELVIDPLTGRVAPQPPWHARFFTECDPRSLYSDQAETRRAKAERDIAMALGPIRQLLNSQGMDFDAYGVTRWALDQLDAEALESKIVPLSPMAMQMMLMGKAQGQQREGAVTQFASGGGGGGGGPMSDLMNSEPTNGLIRGATQMASPARQSQTAPGANNARSPVGAAA